ncbi:hypothetical protein [Streptomyces mayteni]
MESGLSTLTVGLVLLALLCAVAGLHAYVSGRAQARTLVDRLAAPSVVMVAVPRTSA